MHTFKFVGCAITGVVVSGGVDGAIRARVLVLAFVLFIASVTITNALTLTSTTLISKLTPSSYGQKVAFVATISKPVPNGENVSFYDGNILLGKAQTASASATFATSALSGGSHSITAVYQGDSTYNKSTSSVLTQTVRAVTPSVSLTSQTTQVIYGQPVAVSALISGNYLNGESVFFLDGNRQIGTVKISSGAAIFTNSTLGVGSHSIMATYYGDANYTRAASNTLAITVAIAPTSVSLVSATSGISRVLSATVSSQYATVPDNETVTFYDGQTLLGTAKTVSGSASFSYNSLSTGTHSFTASYGGDANFAPSTSPVVSSGQGSGSSCNIGLNVTSAYPNYFAPSKIQIYYTLKTMGQCTASSASGTLTLSSATSGTIYSVVPVNVTSIGSRSITRVVYANSTGAAEGENLATMIFSNSQASNVSTTSFYVIQPAMIKITGLNLTSENSTQVGSPISIATGVLNTADFNADNATLNLKIIQPNLGDYSGRFFLGAIPAFRDLVLNINPGAAAVPYLQGRYQIIENVSYYSNFTAPAPVGTLTSNLTYSNDSSVYYIVHVNRQGGYNGTAYGTPLANAGPLSVRSFPFYTSILNRPSQSALGVISLYDGANYPVTANISAPNTAAGGLSFSQGSVTLQSGGTANIKVQFTPSGNLSGMYVLPISIRTSGQGASVTNQTNIIINLVNSTGQLQILGSMKAFNGNRNASVQFNVVNLENAMLYNLLLHTQLNSSVTGSRSNIATQGTLLNVSSNNYSIEWSAGQLHGGSNMSFSYNLTNALLLKGLINTMTYLSATEQSNLAPLTILGINKPQIVYTNTTANITVSAVYTGLNATTVAFMLIPPSGINVTNPQQSFKVVPDSTIDAKFTIKAGSIPGNYTLKLITPGALGSGEQDVAIDVESVPVQVFTLYDFLQDPRTIFGALTAGIYITILIYGRAKRLYQNRKVKARTTAVSLDSLRSLGKKISVATLKDGERERTFRRHTNKDGTLGGFVEDSAVTGEDVIVAQGAIVERDSILSGNSKALGRATITGHAVIRGSAVISGNGTVGDDAEVYGSARVSGSAKVFGQSEVYDYAQVSGSAEVFGDAHVFGEASVSGTAKVYGSAQVSGSKKVRKGVIKKRDEV